MNELHDYDINFWIGIGDVLHTVRMEQYPNRDVAVVAGVDELMTWASGQPDFPVDAVNFWFGSKANTSLTFQDVQSELESRWGIQFGAKQVDNAAPPPPPKPQTEKLSKQTKPANLDITDTDDLDITALLKQRATTLTERHKRLAAEVAAKQRLLDETERAIDNIHVMLLAAASAKENGYGRKGRSKRADQTGGKDAREVQQARRGRPRRDEGRASGVDAGSGSAGNGDGIVYQAK